MGSYAAGYPPQVPPSAGFADPVPLVPLVVPDQQTGSMGPGAGFGGGTLASSTTLALPILLPLLIILLVPLILGAPGGGGSGGGGPLAKLLLKLLKRKKKKKKPYGYDEQQVPYEMPSAMTDSPFMVYQRASGDGSRTGREIKEPSALPSLSVGEVEKLTSIVLTALRSQECVQRMLCEAGSLSRLFSAAEPVARAVEPFFPDSMKSSFDIFVAGEHCDRYVCASLVVEDPTWEPASTRP